MRNSPYPLGYIEVQRSWVGADNPDMSVIMLNEVYATMSRDEPTLMPYGSRVEMMFDGAGVPHFNLYVGFAPRTTTTPPLDPKNMNDAPAPRIGDASPEMAVQAGWKEGGFKR